jgi:hypothetical protein
MKKIKWYAVHVDHPHCESTRDYPWLILNDHHGYSEHDELIFTTNKKFAKSKMKEYQKIFTDATYTLIEVVV